MAAQEAFTRGYRYRKNAGNIPGHPDIWLKKYNTAIFVHGCFWHRHVGCKYAYSPKSRIDFWTKKFEDNINRDYIVRQELQSLGIKCLIVWECTVKKMEKNYGIRVSTLDKIVSSINDKTDYLEF